MNHSTFNSSVGEKTVEIKHSANSIMIKCLFSIAAHDPALSQAANAMAVIQKFKDYVCGNATINIRLQHKSGRSIPLRGNMPIFELAEIHANNSGKVNLRRIDMTDDVSTSFMALFTIDLSNSGSVPLDGDQWLDIEIKGLSTYTDGALVGVDPTWYVNSYGSDKLSNDVIQFVPIDCDANQTVGFDVDGAYDIALPYPAPELYLQSQSASGKADYLKAGDEELMAIATDRNETVYNVEGSEFINWKWAVIPCMHFVKGTVRLTTDSNVYLIRNISL